MIRNKGTYGYIKRGRITFAIVTIFLFAAVLIMYFGAKWYFKTNKNAFTIFAALSCIGVGKFAVDLVMFLRASGCSEKARDAIEAHIGKLSGAYDLYMTSYDKNYAISHAVCAAKSVCALTEDEKCDIKSAEGHIRTVLANDGYKDYTVKIFRNPDQYTERLEQMNRLPESKDNRSVQGVLDVLKSVSL